MRTRVKDPVVQVLEQPFGFNTAEADQDEVVTVETRVTEGDGGGVNRRKITGCAYTELTRFIHGLLNAQNQHGYRVPALEEEGEEFWDSWNVYKEISR